jgi:hypothetical protein
MFIVVAVAAAPDQIELDTVAEEGHRQRPPVFFAHDLHTAALAEGGTTDCARCHERDAEGGLVFATASPVDRLAARDTAHRSCGDCHLDLGRGPHPALCAACHVARMPAPDAERSSGMAVFDHDGHLAALADDCDRCHHVADPDTGHLVPAGGEEAACADCHDGTAGRSSLRLAAHASCVACHEGGDGPAVGPTTCADCHEQ